MAMMASTSSGTCLPCRASVARRGLPPRTSRAWSSMDGRSTLTMRREVDFVDHQQVAAQHAGPRLRGHPLANLRRLSNRVDFAVFHLFILSRFGDSGNPALFSAVPHQILRLLCPGPARFQDIVGQTSPNCDAYTKCANSAHLTERLRMKQAALSRSKGRHPCRKPFQQSSVWSRSQTVRWRA